MDEDFNQLVMVCDNCHLQFYAKELQNSPITDTLMCINCLRAPGSKLNIIKDRALPKARSQIPIITQARPTPKEQPLNQDGFSTFECTNCRYVLKRRSNYKGSCPYCNKKTLKMKR